MWQATFYLIFTINALLSSAGQRPGSYYHGLVQVCVFFPFKTIESGLSKFNPFQGFYVSAVQVFWNTVGKGEIACNKRFLLFPQCFLPVWRTFCHFYQLLKLLSANSFNLED